MATLARQARGAFQTNASPWGKRMRVDPQTRAVMHEEPRREPAEELASEIVSARLQSDALQPDDLVALRRLGHSASLLREEGPGATQAGGIRRTQWAGSPVKSSYFL